MLDTPDITVLIKAPNQKHDDHPVQCRGTWTVQQLKGHLAENYPTKPTLREQRLIYSGQLLTDDSRLGDVLRRHDDDSTVHTVHLVCAPPAEPAPSHAGGGLRHRRQQQQQAAPQPQPQQPPQPQVAAAAAPPAGALPHQYDLGQWAQQLHGGHHQLLAMQHMYSQYWAQYAQMMQYGPGSMPLIWPQPTPVPAAGSGHLPAAAAAAHTPPPAAPAPAPAAAQQPPPAPAPAANNNQNVRLNAQGGVMEEEEDAGGQWDWLDWLHGLARLSVLFLAVYFYASVSRLVLVLGFGFLAYLYNQGYFQPARVAPPPAPAPAPAAAPAPAPAPAPAAQPGGEDGGDAAQPPQREDGQEERREDRREDGELRVSEELRRVMEQMGVEPPQLENRPHPFTLAWTFFISFFASLIPDRIEQ
ncbi:homocysteine-responsive endoplasmic reticulum-resident ubiquitin-like domain member 2 protein [Amphibalanus amphitrite]|uniref:homocysteine-responsive endoplasmic reticulum-resident ubiquitin-like domain member 2 protein n=1 Tax=Amphibalanus amphitrite TaxID=1232801 RepID=UPI001C8FABE9|nr:homocysteine-responsive endoplasmic reticulum-resident ubiquitin-like domain member 2 protein [Amphibalanus amphitrite]